MFNQISEAAPTPIGATLDAAPGARILIVDDDPVVAGILGVTLAAAGHEIVELSSGEEALSQLAGLNRASLPDIVFLDIEMGSGIDGFEVCRQLKANPATAHIPLIFLTAKTDVASEQLGLALGAVDYITKPISPPIVYARVRTHLALKAAADFLHDRNAWLEQEVVLRVEEALRRKEALRITEESRLTLSRAIEQSPVSIVITDARAAIEYVNPKFETDSGYRLDEVIGKNPRMFGTGEKSPEACQAMWASLAEQKTWHGKFHNRRKDGTLFWAEASIYPVCNEDGGLINFVAVTEDITERMAASAALLAALAAAEAANIAKSNFLANMSHEIRTPLNGILGMAQILLMPDIPASEREDFTRTILRSGQTLLALLNDILDITKIESGKIEVETVEVAPGQLVFETRTLFAEIARSKGLIIESDWRGPPHFYLSDPLRLRQMLSNLLNNAVKFTARGLIRIEAREIECEGRTAVLEFSVTDTGIGIPEDKQALLFQRFSQTDASSTRNYGGSGLGLSIVADLAKLMGGNAGVESQAGQGSRFWFRIRAVRVATGAGSCQTETRSAGSSASTGMVPEQFSGRVLVVEDIPTNRKVIDSLLTRLGVSVAMVEDGQQGVARITGGEHADLIFMDLDMPVMDGYTATERIRQWESAQNRSRCPIIALTANTFEEDRLRCLAAGMDDFVSKPIALDSIKAMLTRWLPATPDRTDPAAITTPVAVDKPVDIPAIILLLDEILPLITRNKFNAIGRFKALEEAVAGTVVAAEIAETGRLLGNFNFDLALEHLRRIAVANGWEVATDGELAARNSSH